MDPTDILKEKLEKILGKRFYVFARACEYIKDLLATLKAPSGPFVP